MYVSSYNKLFWAMLIIIFDFNIGSINILPNFIGYLMIYSALNTLAEQHEIFEKGRMPSLILVILTLDTILKSSQNNVLFSQNTIVREVMMIKGAATMIINLYLMFIICKGILLLSEARALENLKNSIQSRWNVYFIISAAIIFCMPFSLSLPRNFNIIMILLGVVNIIASLFIAGIFKAAKNKLGE